MERLSMLLVVVFVGAFTLAAVALLVSVVLNICGAFSAAMAQTILGALGLSVFWALLACLVALPVALFLQEMAGE